jgi:Ca2+-binding RTX toxin-like protein
MISRHASARLGPSRRPSKRLRRHTAPWLLAAIALFVFPSSAVGELNPADVSGKGESASRPRIASDGAGNIVAIWRAAYGDTSAIRAAFQPAGGTWASARRISTAAAGTESPRVAMDRLGNAVAVWQRSSGHDSVVQAAIRPAGGTWSEPDDLSGPGEVAFNADVAARAGKMTAVWTVLRDRRTSVESSSRTVGGSWARAQTLSGPIGNASAPVIAVADQGAAVASWRWSDGAFLVVQAAMRSNDGVWSAPEVLSGPGRSASQPQVAMDASGNAVVAWIRYNGSWTAPQITSRTAGGKWEAVQNLSERGGNARRLDLAMNSSGDAAVTWIQGRLEASADLWSSFRPAASRRWNGAPVTEGWDGLEARIALDEQGNATAVWAGSFLISASFKPVGEAWQGDYLLSSYDHYSAQPAVTTQRPENATAVWVRRSPENEEPDDYVQAVSYDVNTSKEEEEEDEEEEDGEESTTEGLTYRGTPGADTLVGTPGDDVFYGYGGSDSINGRGGRDVVYGGPGIDLIKGGTDSDRLFGGLGGDRIIGGPGKDILRGGQGSDVLRSNRGRDVVYGGTGRDRLAGGTGADRLFGGFGRDRIQGGRGDDLLSGGRGKDLLSGGSGNDALRARDGRPDTVFGGTGLDFYGLDRWLDRARSIESRL